MQKISVFPVLALKTSRIMFLHLRQNVNTRCKGNILVIEEGVRDSVARRRY